LRGYGERRILYESQKADADNRILLTVSHESVKAPPRDGPDKYAIDCSEAKNAIIRGRSRMGISWPIMIKPTLMMPAAPIPETARPRMKTSELGDAALKMDPISKTTTESM
jgi:hypothetical protein